MSSFDEQVDSESKIQDWPLTAVLEAITKGSPSTSSAPTAELIRRFRPLILAFWRKYRVGEFDDFLQDVVLRMFASLPQLHDFAAFPGFFRRIVLGAATDRLRAATRYERMFRPLEPEDLEQSFDAEIAAPLMVRSLLELLTDQERRVVELSFFEDLDAAEVGRRLGMSASGIRATKSRAISRLRDILTGGHER